MSIATPFNRTRCWVFFSLFSFCVCMVNALTSFLYITLFLPFPYVPWNFWGGALLWSGSGYSFVKTAIRWKSEKKKKIKLKKVLIFTSYFSAMMCNMYRMWGMFDIAKCRMSKMHSERNKGFRVKAAIHLWKPGISYSKHWTDEYFC